MSENATRPTTTTSTTTAGSRYLGEHPREDEMAEILLGVFQRLRLTSLLRHHRAAPVLALFSFINGCLSIGLMAVAALVTHAPVLFPSLGLTAFLFFYTPRTAAASPRNTLIGHTLGAAAGWLRLVLFGLRHAGPALAIGVSAPRVLAAALSLGLTGGLMVLLRAPHPLAGTTTLIVSLGLLPQFWQLGVLLLAVALLTVQAVVINRLTAIAYPLWNPPPPSPRSPLGMSGGEPV